MQHVVADRLVASHACQRRLPAAGGVVELQHLQIVGLRSDGDVAVFRAIRCREHLVQDGPDAAVEPVVAPQLGNRFCDVAGIEVQRAFDRQAVPAVAAGMTAGARLRPPVDVVGLRAMAVSYRRHAIPPPGK